MLRASARADLATQSDAIVNGSKYHGEIAKANPKNTPATPFSPKKPANMVLEKNMVFFFFSIKLILCPGFVGGFFLRVFFLLKFDFLFEAPRAPRQCSNRDFFPRFF